MVMFKRWITLFCRRSFARTLRSRGNCGTASCSKVSATRRRCGSSTLTLRGTSSAAVDADSHVFVTYISFDAQNVRVICLLLKFTSKAVASSRGLCHVSTVASRRAYGDHKHCRKILSRALNSVTDWPEYVVDAYVMFEREEGTLEQLDQCLEKCDSQMKRIEERKRAVSGR